MADFSDVLLTVDYDRTLTAPDSTIPARNLEAIRYFMENGGAFTVNTGRSVPMFRSIWDKVPVNAPLLLYNGSAACDHDTGELSACRPFDMDLWATVEELLRMFPHLTVEVQGRDAHYAFLPNPRWDAFNVHNGCPHATAEWGQDLGPFLKFRLDGQFHDNTVARLFEATPEEKAEIDAAEEALRRRWGDKIEIFRSATRLIDVHARGVNKGDAARNLKAHLGRKILVCVGDAHNDLAMMDAADYAYCPADAVIADRYENVCKCADGAVADVIYEKIPNLRKKA